MGLLRALVRNCKVLLLDEATSSLDPETDALIQTIIQTKFKDITVSPQSLDTKYIADKKLISIAHRLQTVAYYDRILVLDNGQVKEASLTPALTCKADEQQFDAPLALFDQSTSTFRLLCDQKVSTLSY